MVIALHQSVSRLPIAVPSYTTMAICISAFIDRVFLADSSVALNPCSFRRVHKARARDLPGIKGHFDVLRQYYWVPFRFLATANLFMFWSVQPRQRPQPQVSRARRPARRQPTSQSLERVPSLPNLHQVEAHPPVAAAAAGHRQVVGPPAVVEVGPPRLPQAALLTTGGAIPSARTQRGLTLLEMEEHPPVVAAACEQKVPPPAAAAAAGHHQLLGPPAVAGAAPPRVPPAALLTTGEAIRLARTQRGLILLEVTQGAAIPSAMERDELVLSSSTS